MDKLTIISGCLFLAADIFAIASIANPDWINTGESAVPFADEETYSERGMIWRSTHCGPCATVSDNPWTRPNMHPTSAAPGVGDHTVFYHHGNHFIDCHMWFAGGFPLAKRSYKICSMDSIHWNSVAPRRHLSISGNIFGCHE
ncbi:modulator of smoothened protein isoform X4 [Myotis myotis]|uniref:modulator of smoothened protein isoform X4 n=1 Tax=Myotis myotis TaxID=51298 RepID=UPI0017481CCB|nr:modulator of smoothened protein isoform X4 [Myotis myotis]